eukprot:TRINITY_DN336_c0_g1_i5.p1 TRINITY_DN336_c0_g1~~TRINITY_DN336_c0_g1_i5.p1  ORF type:complete len:214 (+),score=-2.24 TRINITY_DN336_c0_g1_i5:215-856(+)
MKRVLDTHLEYVVEGSPIFQTPFRKAKQKLSTVVTNLGLLFAQQKPLWPRINQSSYTSQQDLDQQTFQLEFSVRDLKAQKQFWYLHHPQFKSTEGGQFKRPAPPHSRKKVYSHLASCLITQLLLSMHLSCRKFNEEFKSVLILQRVSLRIQVYQPTFKLQQFKTRLYSIFYLQNSCRSVTLVNQKSKIAQKFCNKVRLLYGLDLAHEMLPKKF